MNVQVNWNHHKNKLVQLYLQCTLKKLKDDCI